MWTAKLRPLKRTSLVPRRFIGYTLPSFLIIVVEAQASCVHYQHFEYCIHEHTLISLSTPRAILMSLPNRVQVVPSDFRLLPQYPDQTWQ